MIVVGHHIDAEDYPRIASLREASTYKVLPEESELEKGKKRGVEGAILPPPQRGRRTDPRSVPPGSATAIARQRAEASRFQDPKGKGSTKGTSQGKDKTFEVKAVEKLPPEFEARPSTAEDIPIDELRNKLKNRGFYDRTWELLQKILIDLGVTMGNLMSLEYTYAYWYRQFENLPMNLAMEAVLQPLYKVELQSWIEDLAEEESEELKASHTEIIIDSLTNVKNFISSWGFTMRDFFEKDKRSFNPVEKGKGKSKDQPKGGKTEQLPAAGGKEKGRSGSMNTPKEPAPVAKQGETAPVSLKDPQPAVEQTSWSSIVKSGVPVLQGPPAKTGEPVLPKSTPQGPPTKAEEHVSPVETKEAPTPTRSTVQTCGAANPATPAFGGRITTCAVVICTSREHAWRSPAYC